MRTRSRMCDVEDISARTIPKDFERNPHIHRCFVSRTAEPRRDAQILDEAGAAVAHHARASCRWWCSWAGSCCRAMWDARSGTARRCARGGRVQSSGGRRSAAVDPVLGLDQRTSSRATWADPSPSARRWRRSSARRWSNSLKLAALAFVLVVPLGIAGGVWAAMRVGRWSDRGTGAARPIAGRRAGIHLLDRAHPDLRRLAALAADVGGLARRDAGR